ncbi:uncharacterized protein LOC106153747 [Lingula anatina]|uniref:Uncharacterized protein LOC106153747 n=1 Tax=Lingula anatina TaxID=7574 RepID=A0A1S3HBA3_LINAN|nr:uncharacterized protein LOC106153747 [Lingula anatina]XP_013383291.1 uncharacterized protein LOC106153747 [Lingula anatina]XP_013383292.1 uncharacterized protein LOC106153747 [Lingula anatina]XP_013383293.1 uncharacterized protein LOC106153747 [Lingula anatina]XP_013383294.1 uncharacterized protein LOC106153747 [Lingula anatina]|eukprot:XP_013383290.1 uncharacterized protein LOC106153747 [Lingula anatina]
MHSKNQVCRESCKFVSFFVNLSIMNGSDHDDDESYFDMKNDGLIPDIPWEEVKDLGIMKESSCAPPQILEELEDPKMRIDFKLAWIRSELIKMRQQDEDILGQLLQIHDSIMQIAHYRSLPRRRISRGGSPIIKSESMRVPPNYSRLGVPIFPTKKYSEPEKIHRSFSEYEENDEEDDAYYIYDDSMTSLDSLDSVGTENVDREFYDSVTPLPRYSTVTRSVSFNDKDCKIKHTNSLTRYDVSYEELMRRSKIWREVERERATKGRVDERKLAALKLIM